MDEGKTDGPREFSQEITFSPSTEFSFSFRKEAKVGAVADVDDSTLYAR